MRPCVEIPAWKLRVCLLQKLDNTTRQFIPSHVGALEHHHTDPRNSISNSSPTMPPKKQDKGPAKKVDAKKLVEDKTFGMKNKKGGAAKKTIAQLAASTGAEQKRREAENKARLAERKAAEDAKKEAEQLMNRPAQIQKVPFGVDPKTVLCIFFKKGNCEKGKKCKFSHDLAVERKVDKRDLYQDTRADEDDKKKQETSADWDEEKLRSVVLSKKGNQRSTTDKVCKFFISAIEDGKYGWFWICPNGGDKCMYKHALPPGYVFPRMDFFEGQANFTLVSY